MQIELGLKNRISRVLTLTDAEPLLKEINCSERGLPSQHVLTGWHDKMIGRYTYASEFTKGKVVLDACCGIGWGAYLLATNATKNYAIDKDIKSIDFIDSYWREPKIISVCSDIFTLGLEEKVDVITLMEAIEHFQKEDGVKLIGKLCSLLKQDGVIIGSSLFPHKKSNALRLQDKNPYHLYIYTKSEIKQVLGSFFKDIQILKGKLFIGANRK